MNRRTRVTVAAGVTIAALAGAGIAVAGASNGFTGDDDGSQVDVQLDAAFNVVGSEADSDDGTDSD